MAPLLKFRGSPGRRSAVQQYLFDRHPLVGPMHTDDNDLSRTELRHLLDSERIVRLDLEQDNQRLRDAAIYDALTGLHSRAYMQRELAKWWASSCYTALHERRYGSQTASLSRPFAVILLDIDYFKRVNDAHGHDVGDLVLRQVADVLQATVRASDVVGRWGGEEFLVLLPHTTATSALHLAERLRHAVAQAHIEHEGSTLGVTVSLGVSGAGPGNPAEAPLAVVSLADAALYEAKDHGRNRVEQDFVESCP